MITLCAVITQGILGGLTVLYFLPAWLSASLWDIGSNNILFNNHISCNNFKWYKNEAIKSNSKITKLSFVAVALVWTQLIIGAIVRHTESALVALDFPKINDTWIPAFDHHQLIKSIMNAFIQNFDFILNLDPITSGQLFYILFIDHLVILFFYL